MIDELLKNETVGIIGSESDRTLKTLLSFSHLEGKVLSPNDVENSGGLEERIRSLQWLCEVTSKTIHMGIHSRGFHPRALLAKIGSQEYGQKIAA